MTVAGFGFRKAAALDSLRDALHHATQNHAQVTALATAADKADTPVFRQFAAELALPVHRIAPHHLRAAETITEAPTSRTARGTGSLAEAAALCAAGQHARLVQTRVTSNDRMATCALATGDKT
ncbi:cobalamin biosynthesis protein [Marinovum sp. KMM 9879]